jgi:hypothetical protein
MYNASLTIYYVLDTVKEWNDHDVVKIEPFLHANAIAWGLGTGLASLALTLFNPVGWDFWLSAAPLGCEESWNSPDGTTTFERGDNGSIYQWVFYYVPLWFVIILVVCLLYWVYHDVSAHERRVQEQYQETLSVIPSDTISNDNKIAGQAAAYVGSFFFTWLFPTISQLVIVTMGSPPWILLFLTVLFVPIPGIFILVICIRPAYLKKQTNPPRRVLYRCLV